MVRFYFVVLAYFILEFNLFSQLNTTLFFMPNSPQANFVNPAVSNECKLLIGLPVISSVHLNAGNSGFSLNQVLKKQSDNTYLFDGNSVMNNLGGTNYFDSEVHSNLAFVGFWLKDNYITFAVNEKFDFLLTYPSDLFAFAWKGNSQFEGKTAEFSRTSAFMNYRREYAFGITRNYESEYSWGIRGKFLFGKLNTSMNKSKINFFTDPNNFDLNFDSDWQMNTSLPINVSVHSNDTLNSIAYNGTLGGVLLNRKNLGFATDLGFIRFLDNRTTIAGSLLDAGFIFWKDNGHSFTQNGHYAYHGPLGDSIDEQSYLDDLTRVLKDEFGIRATKTSYLQFLSPRIYLGGTYKLRNDLTVGLVGTSKITRYKIISAVTLSLNKEFSKKFSGSVSYSYMYRSLKNIGLGIKVGRSPAQFYLVSDNILGFINPMSARTVNLRFGLQLNFGCNRREKLGGCGCSGLESEINHKARLNKLLRKKVKE